MVMTAKEILPAHPYDKSEVSMDDMCSGLIVSTLVLFSQGIFLFVGQQRILLYLMVILLKARAFRFLVHGRYLLH
jgi:hypothetical protein